MSCRKILLSTVILASLTAISANARRGFQKEIKNLDYYTGRTVSLYYDTNNTLKINNIPDVDKIGFSLDRSSGSASRILGKPIHNIQASIYGSEPIELKLHVDKDSQFETINVKTYENNKIVDRFSISVAVNRCPEGDKLKPEMQVCAQGAIQKCRLEDGPNCVDVVPDPETELSACHAQRNERVVLFDGPCSEGF